MHRYESVKQRCVENEIMQRNNNTCANSATACLTVRYTVHRDKSVERRHHLLPRVEHTHVIAICGGEE
jgi:hypothetical protein